MKYFSYFFQKAGFDIHEHINLSSDNEICFSYFSQKIGFYNLYEMSNPFLGARKKK